ncbi:MAG: tetratricopeptide repeat protein [Planctomycetota bacterium]|jgi:DNA-directed RNA polymerase subunit alpha
MVSLADAPVNLFEKELPGFDEIKRLWRYVNSSESNRIEFRQSAEGQKDALVKGIALLLCGVPTEAAGLLEKGKDCVQKQMALGYAFRQLGKFEASIQSFDAAAKLSDGIDVALEKCETYRLAGNFEACEKELASCRNFENVSAEYHYQKGCVQDRVGNYEEAMNQYELAIDLDHSHTKALFALAFSFDLRGDEQEATHYYKELVQVAPAHVNGLLNLAVLYEDSGEYDRALNCVESVLNSHPNHTKAQLFKKDIISARVMIYDEEKEKRRDHHNKILEIPISDFELSVRSRNCLKKMNIHTLGDLLRTSESELLSYKNFGETSLQEIKQILEMKDMRLGMALEDKNAVKPIDPEIANQASPEILNQSIGEMGLSVRARRALDRLGVKTVLELISKTEAELLGCKNFGVTSLNEIKECLEGLGLSLRKLE